MTLTIESREVTFAVEAVRQAAMLAREVQTELVQPALTKDDRSPVTVADFAAQAYVGRLLTKERPDEPLVGEEGSEALRASDGAETLEQVVRFVARRFPAATADTVCEWIDRGGMEPAPRFWTLDPVDGTKGFLRGEQYAVALALIEDGQVQLGVLGCPNLTDGYRAEPGGPGTIVMAVRGQGAWHASLGPGTTFQRMHVSEVADPTQARLLRSVEAAHTNTGRIGQLIEDMGVVAEPVRLDSQAKYSVLGCGQGDALVRLLSSRQPDYREKIWDQAAGSIVVEESGGRITDLYGKPLDFTQGRTLANNRGVLATNGHLHEIALEALQRVL
ncbi:MAG: 3'(2'),5'-bisphosphate nucleotidase [bacterium]|nr:3'(2'),5'-bisphosphate nucleotidase [bacterium]